MLSKIKKHPLISALSTASIGLISWFSDELKSLIKDNWSAIENYLLNFWTEINLPICIPIWLLTISIPVIALIVPFCKTTSKSKDISLLNKQINDAESLIESGALSQDELNSWKLVTENVLAKIFGPDTPNANALTSKGSVSIQPMYPTEKYHEEKRVESLNTMISKLRSLVEVRNKNIK